VKKKDIIIVGAGLVGSLLALTLARRGHKVRVFERRPDMRKAKISAGRSINLALSERGLRALERVGVDAAVREVALPMKGRVMHDASGELSFQPYGKEGQVINSVSRGALNKLLMDRACAHDDVEFTFHARCTGIDFEQPALEVEDLESGAQTTHRADLVFGADGAFSAVRLAMQMRPRVSYRQDYLAHGYKELTIPPTKEPGEARFALDPGALHIWPRGGDMLIALPNLDGSFTCTLFLPHAGSPSFGELTSPAAVTRFFEERFPDAVPLMPGLVQDFFDNPTGDLLTIRCSPWSVGGRVCASLATRPTPSCPSTARA
jgi:kynurenine 3-monooxygenase